MNGWFLNMNLCFFCNNIGGRVLYQDENFRIILIEDASYPGYLRIVSNLHVKELTDLSDDDNLILYRAVMKSEKILREIMDPEKVNIASFGNMTPHVHWHLIPRYKDDKHFPNPTWGEVTNSAYAPSVSIMNQEKLLVDKFFELFTA